MQGKTITAEVEIENVGEKDGTQDIKLFITHDEEEDIICDVLKNYFLESGQLDTVKFENIRIPVGSSPGKLYSEN